MSLVTLAGSTVLRAHVELPLHGAWTVEAKVDTATLPSGSVQVLCDGGLTLTGTVTRGGVFLDVTHLWVVGGAGGLATTVSGAFQSAQLRDPLNAIMQASGETLSSAVASSLLSVSLPLYTLGKSTASAALSSLCRAAGDVLGSAINWRVLPDGTIWMGAETWAAAAIPDSDEILDVLPTEGRTVIGVATPTLTAGVNLSGVGSVLRVDHWIERSKVRSWAWV